MYDNPILPIMHEVVDLDSIVLGLQLWSSDEFSCFYWETRRLSSVISRTTTNQQNPTKPHYTSNRIKIQWNINLNVNTL